MARVKAVFVAVVGIWTGMSTTALASFVTFSGSDASQNLSANVTFTDLGGGGLEVSLVNSFTGDTVDQAHVLTGVFFSGAVGLTPVSATAGPGSLEWVAGSSSAPPPSSFLGTEWAYGTGTAPGSATAGIVSAGYYTPGNGNFASGGDMLDGSGWGILSAGYAGSHLDGLDSRPYIQNTIVFDLSGFNGNLSGIGNVTFQYGTSLSEPSTTGSQVPEPASLCLAMFGAVLLLRRR